MKRVVAGDIVFTPFGSSYDRVRVILGKAYRLRMSVLSKINSKVDVVSENVFSPRVDPLEIGGSASDLADSFPIGVDVFFEGSRFIDIGGGRTMNPVGIGDSAPIGAGSTPVGTDTPEFVFQSPIPQPVNLRGYGQRSDFIDTGTTVPIQPVVEVLGGLIRPIVQSSTGSGGSTPPAGSTPVVEVVGGLIKPKVQRSSGSGGSTPPAGFQVPSDTVLNVPLVDTSAFEQFPLESGGTTQPEFYLPSFILDQNPDDIFSENISFRPRLSIHKASEQDGDWDVYWCKLKIPGLMDLVEQTGKSTREILSRLADFGTISPFVVYMLGVKGVLEEVIASNRIFLDYQFDFSLMDVDDPQVSDLTIEPKYNFYDAKFEKNTTWLKEPAISNFYYMGKESGEFSARNIDYLNAAGTNTSSMMVASSQAEMDVINHYYSYRGAVPFGVEVESDVDYSRFANLLGEQKLLKQFGMNLASPNRGMTYFCDRKNVAISSGERGLLYSADTFRTHHWLNALYDKRAFLFYQDQADATVFSLLPAPELRGEEQNKTLRSGQAKRVLIATDRIMMSDARDLFGCIKDEDALRERVGFQVNKSRAGIVHKLFGLSSGASFSRMKLFDSQLFFGQKYQYETLGIYSVFANEYFYAEKEGKPLFDVEKLELYFSIKMRPTSVAVVLPNSSKSLKISSALPMPPSVRVDQYRDLKSEKADVLFLLNNTTGSMTGDFVGIEERDLSFAATLIGSFGAGNVPFGNDDPIVKLFVYRLPSLPTSWSDFAEGVKTEINNVILSGGKTLILDSNSFFDMIPMDQDFYYAFRQEDIHGLLSNPTNVFQIRAIKVGSRYRVSCREWTMEELLASQKSGTNEFKTAKRFVCVLPNAEWMKRQTAFSKQYRLRLISTQSKRVVDVDFEVKMAKSRETY